MHELDFTPLTQTQKIWFSFYLSDRMQTELLSKEKDSQKCNVVHSIKRRVQ